MWNHYFALGLRSLRRNPALTVLMVLTLAVGVGASVATSTLLHAMGANPMPSKSDRLFVPLFDVSPPERPKRPDYQVTYPDTANLLASGQGVRRTAIFGVALAVQPQRKELGVIAGRGLAVTADFFPMFETPFLAGNAWSPQDDAKGADVVVMSRAMAEKTFGTPEAVGKQIEMGRHTYTVVGVLKPWLPVPRFYRLVGGPGAFGKEDEFYIPLANGTRHEMQNNGSTSCYARVPPGYQARLDSDCIWLQFWFELQSAADRPALQSYLDAYATQQRKLGRMKRVAPAELFNVTQWLEHLKVVGNDNRLAVWLSFGFLLLCLVNTVGLLLAKFSVRASEVGVRRALGASRADVFKQFMVEAVVVGLAGGLLGLLMAWGALALIALQSEELALVARLDAPMLALTFGLSVLAAVLAGLLPTWRACNVSPAWQLKSQ
jgi:putative ABC transport system permease protein